MAKVSGDVHAGFSSAVIPGMQIAIHLVWHPLFHRSDKGRCAGCSRFLFFINVMSKAATLLSNFCVLRIEFNPNKVTSEFQSHLSGAARAAKGITDDASPDPWSIRLPFGILTPRFDSLFFLGP